MDNAVFMTAPKIFTGHIAGISALFAVTVILVWACGCTNPVTTPEKSVTPMQTAMTIPGSPAADTPGQDGKKMVTFNEKDNGTTAEIAAGTRFMVQLAENPTTGFSWNASTSPGLTVLSSEYAMNEHAAGMVGAGGIHTWILQASGSGRQTFSATYLRPWEPVSGNESAYALTIQIMTV